MNIFATSPSAKDCAKNLDDARVVKMVVETSQILSTATSVYGFDSSRFGLPKPTHHAHPVVQWAGASRANFDWTFDHFRALLAEYKFRYAKQHRYFDHIKFYLRAEEQIKNLFKIEELQAPANCACNLSLGLDFRHIDDVHLAYREYLKVRWETSKRPPKWTNRTSPYWLTENEL